jgi:spore coat protein U-like protein
MQRLMSRILFALGLVLVAGEAHAQAVPINISAAVVRSCAVTASTPNINVAAYDPNAAAATTADGSLTIQCTRGTQYSWIVNDGLNASATSRRLASALGPTEWLGYDVLMSINGFASTTTAPLGMAAPVAGERATGRQLPMTLGVRVSLPPNQDVSANVGAYTDTVNVTIAVAP